MKIWGEDGDAAYYNHAILITGLTGIATMLPSLYFYQKDRRARIIGGIIKSGVMRHLKIGECVRILLMGAGFAQFANMLVNILGSFLNADAYQESMSQMTDGKSLLFLISVHGNHSTSGRGNDLSLADLSETERLYAGSPCDGDFGGILWNLSWKSGSGRLCEYSWNSVCVFYGTDRKLMGKCTASCGSKYLVTDPS